MWVLGGRCIKQLLLFSVLDIREETCPRRRTLSILGDWITGPWCQCDLNSAGSALPNSPPKLSFSLASPKVISMPLLYRSHSPPREWCRITRRLRNTGALGVIWTRISVWAVVVVQSLGHVLLFETLWTAACQASLSFTISQSLIKLISVESVMPSNHLILCHLLLL